MSERLDGTSLGPDRLDPDPAPAPRSELLDRLYREGRQRPPTVYPFHRAEDVEVPSGPTPEVDVP